MWVSEFVCGVLVGGVYAWVGVCCVWLSCVGEWSGECVVCGR